MLKNFAAFAVLVATAAGALADGMPPDILKANKLASGGSAWDLKSAVSVDADYSGEGLTGTTHTLTDLKNGRSYNAIKLGIAEGANGFDGKTPWERDTSGAITAQEGGDAVTLAINEAYRNANLWWQPGFGGAAIAGEGERTDSTGRYDVLAVAPKGGKPFEAWFESRTHLLARVIEMQGPQTVITNFGDYRPEHGVMMAHKIIVDTGVGARYLQTITVTKVTFLGPQPDEAFARPKIVIDDYAIKDGASATTVPVKLVNNHIYGETMVNGKGPFTFVFDTGGQDILTPPVAKLLGLEAQGNLAGTGAGEGVVEGGFVNGVTFAIGDATVKNQVAMVLPLDKFGDIEGIPMPGMVGYEVFRRFVTRIDYGARTLTLIDPAKFDPAGAGTPVKFVFADHIPQVDGTIEGIPAKFDIDTGSRVEMTVTKPFAETNRLKESHPKGVTAVDGWGVGGPSTAYVTRLKSVTIAGVDIGPVVAGLADQSKGAFAGSDYSANIGGGLLKRFVVTFDYTRQLMYLKPLSGPVADTGTYDRAGLWLNRSGTGFHIAAVTAGGPAAEAGLKEGDQIVAIDGVAAGNIALPDLRLRLRTDAPGTEVTFTLVRNGTSTPIKVKLRDQI
jgi:hypothetical protein